VRASFQCGATDFLNKPFTPPQLDSRIRSCFAPMRQNSGGSRQQ